MSETLEFTKENFSSLAKQVLDLEAQLDATRKENLTVEVDKQKLLWAMEQAQRVNGQTNMPNDAKGVIESAKDFVAYIDEGLIQAEAKRSVKQ